MLLFIKILIQLITIQVYKLKLKQEDDFKYSQKWVFVNLISSSFVN